MTDCGAKLLVTTSKYADKLKDLSQKIKAKLLVLDEELTNEAVTKKESKSIDTSNNVSCCYNFSKTFQLI